jgi:hypothetical protein
MKAGEFGKGQSSTKAYPSVTEEKKKLIQPTLILETFGMQLYTASWRPAVPYFRHRC